MSAPEMPERIWYHSDGAYLPYQPTMHWEWQEFVRSDLCASGQQVRALEARPWVVFDAVFRFLKIDAKTQEVIDAITSALTPTPQPEGRECSRCGSVGGFGCYECIPPQPSETVAEAAQVLINAYSRDDNLGRTLARLANEAQQYSPAAEAFLLEVAALRALKGGSDADHT